MAYVDPDDASTLVIKDRKKVEEYIDTHKAVLHKNATVESLICHETAHSISVKVGEDEILNGAIKKFEETEVYRKALIEDPMNKYLPSWQIGAESISRTATTTTHELFAEAMADVYQNKDKAEELSKIIYEEFKKVRRNSNHRR